MSRCLLFFVTSAVAALGCGDDTGSTNDDPTPATSTGEESAEREAPTPAHAPDEETPMPDDPNAIVIVPGRSMGPIRLGMTRAEVDALGVLSPHPQYSAMTIPYTVYYDDAGVVMQMEVTLMHAPMDLRVGATIIPKSADFAEAKRLLGDCAADDIREGGTIARCRDGGLQVNMGSGNPDEVWLRITTIDD